MDFLKPLVKDTDIFSFIFEYRHFGKNSPKDQSIIKMGGSLKPGLFSFFFFFFKYLFLFISAAPDLRCSMQTLRSGIWNLVPLTKD